MSEQITPLEAKIAAAQSAISPLPTGPREFNACDNPARAELWQQPEDLELVQYVIKIFSKINSSKRN